MRATDTRCTNELIRKHKKGLKRSKEKAWDRHTQAKDRRKMAYQGNTCTLLKKI